MGFFDKIKQGFKKTSDAVSHSLDSVFAAFVKIDEDLLEELEEALILSDVGASTSAKIVAEVEKRAKLRKTTTASELRDLLRETQTRAPGFEMAIRADLCRLFLWAARQALRSGNQTEFRNIDDAALMTLRRAYSYIDANSAQPLSMEEVAAHCGMKYTAFSRFFARYTQKSFPEYLTEVRLKKATILLTTTQDSVTEIALTAGFSTSSYFIQRFRRKHGVSPGRVRRQFLSGLTPNE